MTQKINKPDVIRFYKLLSHQEETEIRAFKPGANPKIFHVDSEKKFVEVCEELSGKCDIYAGLNERKQGGTAAKDVKTVSSVFIDIDSKHKPATEEELKEAEKVADDIIHDIVKRTVLRPTKIMSGNGYQLIYKIPLIAITDKNREEIEANIQRFQKELMKRYADNKFVKIDNVGDLPRLLRVTGTQNLTGKRISTIVEYNTEPNEKLKEHILHLEPREELELVKFESVNTARIVCPDWIKDDPILNYVLNNQIPDGTSRNITLFKNLAIGLVQSGLSKEKTKEIVKRIVANCEGKSERELYGWIKKARKEKLKYNEAELNKWIDVNKLPIQKYSPKLKTEEENLLSSSKLYYKTEHLPYFDDLRKISKLQGDAYIPILKAIYYSIIGTILRDKKIELANLRTDPRISIILPLPSGQGKKNIKTAVEQVLRKLEYNVEIPLTYHSQQLIGKVVDRGTRRNPNFIKINGYLSRDYLILDEAYNLLTSKDHDITESRRALRISQDPIGENRVEKKLVDHQFNEAERISYFPKCSYTAFTQPKKFHEEIAEEGDLRRVLTLYVRGIAEIDKTEDYRKRLKEEVNVDQHLSHFTEFLNSVAKYLVGKQVVFTEEAIDRLLELHSYLLEQGFIHSEKGYNYTKIVDWTLQDILARLSFLIGASYGHNKVTPERVELAFMDLTEFFALELDFVKDKVLGNLDYGEKWRGASGEDQEDLEWLYRQNATSLEKSTVTIKQFKKQIASNRKISYSAAQKHYYRYVKNKWVNSKQVGPYSTKVWLALKPVLDEGKLKFQGHKGHKAHKEYKSISVSIKDKVPKVLPLLPLLSLLSSDVKKTEKISSEVKVNDKKINTNQSNQA